MDNASCVQQLLAIGRSTAELNEHMSVVQTESLNGQMIVCYRKADTARPAPPAEV